MDEKLVSRESICSTAPISYRYFVSESFKEIAKEALKHLAPHGPDSFVFVLVLIVVMAGLAAGAPPVAAVFIGIVALLLWLVRDYCKAHIETKKNREKAAISANLGRDKVLSYRKNRTRKRGNS